MDELDSVSFLNPIKDGNGRDVFHLSGLSLIVDFVVSDPLGHLLSLGGKERDVVLLCECLNKLLVLSFLAVISKDDQMGLLSIDGFDDFIQTVFDSIVKLRLFDDLGKGGVDVKFFLFLFFRHFNNNTFNR